MVGMYKSQLIVGPRIISSLPVNKPASYSSSQVGIFRKFWEFIQNGWTGKKKILLFKLFWSSNLSWICEILLQI